MDKNLIQKRFSRKLKTYDENARIQKQMAEKLISLLSEKTVYENILEIGCGTGLLTKIVSGKLDYNRYVANDIVSGCSEFIALIDSKIEFIGGDIEKLISNSESKFDLIISNAAIQWIENFEDFVKKLVSMLSPKGILLFSTFGKENFREIMFVLGKTLKYHSLKEIEETFKDYNITAEEDIRIMSFKTPKDVLKHIQNTGVNAISAETWNKKNLSDFESGYNNFCSGRPTLTYNPIYIKISPKT